MTLPRKRTKNRPSTPYEMWWWNDDVHGRRFIDKINPEDLLYVLRDYFDELSDNPIVSEKASVSARGHLVEYKQKDPRAPTVEGFCSYLGISKRLWDKWKSEGEELLVEQCCRVEDTIYSALFERGAIGQFNPMLITRKLKLGETVNRTETVNATVTQETKEFTLNISNLSLNDLKKLNNLMDKAIVDNDERQVIEAQLEPIEDKEDSDGSQ